MGITQITTILAISLSGLLPASCHKTPAQSKVAPAPSKAAVASAANVVTVPVETQARDLGEIVMTNHCETSLVLAKGKNFTLTPRMLDKHNVQLTLSVECKTNAGKTHDLSVTQVVARTGKPLEVAVGDFALTLTPMVSLE